MSVILSGSRNVKWRGLKAMKGNVCQGRWLKESWELGAREGYREEHIRYR